MRRKVMLIGLDCAEPALVLERRRDELPTISGLMERGSYGRLTSVIPPITVPAWSCLLSSKTPGDLGVYGFRNRSDHTYDGGFIAMSTAIKEPRWDLVTRAGGSSIVLSVPGCYPPKPLVGGVGPRRSAPIRTVPDANRRRSPTIGSTHVSRAA